MARIIAYTCDPSPPAMWLRMNPKQIEELISVALPARRCTCAPLDNVHFQATVVSREFEGRRPLQRLQLVYRALGERMGGEIHALQLETFTPEEQAAQAH